MDRILRSSYWGTVPWTFTPIKRTNRGLSSADWANSNN